MKLYNSRILSVSIKRDPRTVYEFILNLENLPKWAGVAFRSIKKQNGEWVVETPQGPAKVRITERNEFGILDHYVNTSSGVEVFVPMRVVQNGDGSEVIFTLFQTEDMSDENYAKDIAMIERDLKNLKNITQAI
jgi:hypothetical protein